MHKGCALHLLAALLPQKLASVLPDTSGHQSHPQHGAADKGCGSLLHCCGGPTGILLARPTAPGPQSTGPNMCTLTDPPSPSLSHKHTQMCKVTPCRGAHQACTMLRNAQYIAFKGKMGGWRTLPFATSVSLMHPMPPPAPCPLGTPPYLQGSVIGSQCTLRLFSTSQFTTPQQWAAKGPISSIQAGQSPAAHGHWSMGRSPTSIQHPHLEPSMVLPQGLPHHQPGVGANSHPCSSLGLSNIPDTSLAAPTRPPTCVHPSTHLCTPSRHATPHTAHLRARHPKGRDGPLACTRCQLQPTSHYTNKGCGEGWQRPMQMAAIPHNPCAQGCHAVHQLERGNAHMHHITLAASMEGCMGHLGSQASLQSMPGAHW